jgi:exodeoxyribonuclease V gamma subunit
LNLFQRDPTLCPHDVIVQMPDIEAYAPLVDAVFGGVEPSDKRYLPYTVADRPQRATSVLAEALATAVRVLAGRMKASEVLDLLQLEPVRMRFGLAGEELPTIQRWVHDAGIRWAADGADRAHFDQPELEENTWLFGLRRLLLGYAMSGPEAGLFCGALPADEIDGDGVRILGHFAEYVEKLLELRTRFRAERSIVDWVKELSSSSEQLFFVSAEQAYPMQVLREQLLTLGEQAAAANFSDSVGVDVLLKILEKRLDSERTSHDFLSGGLTFCTLLPMRSIPFRVVALLGMNDGEFPRDRKRPSFDRMLEDRRAGDRDSRDEDRYLFLEALVSARDRLILSYVGRNVQDNSKRPPSVVVSELLEALRHGYGRGEASLVVEHPLQPWSPRYFGGPDEPRLFAYGHAEAKGATSLSSLARRRVRFQNAPLTPREPKPVLALDELCRFFENPSRALLERELGMLVPDQPNLVEDREPLELVRLEAYLVAADLLERWIDRPPDAAAITTELVRIRAAGALPLGVPGEMAYRALIANVERIANAARPFRDGGRREPKRVELELPGVRIVGSLRDLWQKVQLRLQYSRVGGRHELSFWIRHLFLQCVAGSELPRESVLVGRAENQNGSRDKKERERPHVRHFHPLEVGEARERLGELVQLLELGRSIPLPLFPDSSRAYATAFQKERQKPRAGQEPEKSALKAASDCYFPGRGRLFPEGAERHIRWVFRDEDAIDPSYRTFLDGRLDADPFPNFGQVARRVFEPLLAHSEISEED